MIPITGMTTISIAETASANEFSFRLCSVSLLIFILASSVLLRDYTFESGRIQYNHMPNFLFKMNRQAAILAPFNQRVSQSHVRI